MKKVRILSPTTCSDTHIYSTVEQQYWFGNITKGILAHIIIGANCPLDQFGVMRSLMFLPPTT